MKKDKRFRKYSMPEDLSLENVLENDVNGRPQIEGTNTSVTSGTEIEDNEIPIAQTFDDRSRPVEKIAASRNTNFKANVQNEVNSTMPEFKFKYALNLESEEKTKTILAEEQMFENLIKVTVDEKYNIDFYARGKLRFLFSKICQELKKFGIDFLKTLNTKVKNVFLTLRELLAQITSIRLYRHYLTYLNLIKRYVNRKSIESGKQIMK